MWLSHPLPQVMEQISVFRYETNLKELEFKSPLDYLLALADTPVLTTKVFSMRTAEKRLASQSRFVKLLIDHSLGTRELNSKVRITLRNRLKRRGEKQRRLSKKTNSPSKTRDMGPLMNKEDAYKSTALYKVRQVLKPLSSYQ